MALELKGFDTFHKMMKGGEFESVFNQFMRRKNRTLRELGKSRLQKEINSGNFAQNAAATIAIKGSTKPLIDSGTLRSQVGATGADYGLAFIVGVRRQTGTGKNLAHMLETGWSQDVTPKMRKWFATQAAKSKGRFKPLSKGTTKIFVPPRPFMDRAFFEDRGFADMVVMEWKGVMHQTFMAFVNKGRAERYK